MASFFCCCSCSRFCWRRSRCSSRSMRRSAFASGAVELRQLPRLVGALLLLYQLVGAPVPLFLLSLLLRDLLALLGCERGAHLRDSGVVFWQAFADAEAVWVAAGVEEHVLCAGE